MTVFRALVVLLVLVVGAGFVAYRLLNAEPLPELVLGPDDDADRSSEAVLTAGPPSPDTCIRILTIDGGGVRGLVPALILEELEKLTKKSIVEQFDLVAGASTGALLALGLTRPSNLDARRPAFSASDLVKFYEDHASFVFPDSRSPVAALRQFFRPKYAAHGIASLLDRYFEDVTLAEALTTVLIPAYDIEENRRIWFTSFSSRAHGILMKDIVRGATAAPSYLPPARFATPKSISSKRYVAVVDGALFANNPALEALHYSDRLSSTHGNRDHKSVLVLSLGTGKNRRQAYTFQQAWTWGLLGWAKPLLEIAYNDPAIDDITKSAAVARNGHYERFQLDTDIDLDDASPNAIELLKKSTADLLAQEQDRLRRIAWQLSLPRPDRCAIPLGANYVRPDGPREPVRKRAAEEERKRLAEQLAKEESKLAQAQDRPPQVAPTNPGDFFRDCAVCPEMVVVPAGEFTIGSPPNEEGRIGWEEPPRKIVFAHPFAVGKFEVTFGEWEACFASGDCVHRPDDYGMGRGRRPVVDVSWDDAKSYVAWLSRKTGKSYRLLTEAEWEYSARAGTTTPFWWGASISTSQANYDGEKTYGSGAKSTYRDKTLPVGSFAPNPWGLYDMHGNVGEWVEECTHHTYDGMPTDGTVWLGGDCRFRMTRGGGFGAPPSEVRSAARSAIERVLRFGALGFRVALTLTP